MRFQPVKSLPEGIRKGKYDEILSLIAKEGHMQVLLLDDEGVPVSGRANSNTFTKACDRLGIPYYATSRNKQVFIVRKRNGNGHA